jgi:FAD:protein FMN transferase
MTYFFSLICLFLAGCSSEQKIDPLTVFAGNAMTMDYRILVAAKTSQNDAKQINEIIQTVFCEVNSIYNHWNSDSELSQLNRLPQGLKTPLSKKLETFLRLTQQVVELTEGRFDPTIAPIQRLWKEQLVKGRIPSDEHIQALAQAVGWDKIHFENGFFWKDHDLSSLDLGGIAKGYCVDLLVESLNSNGYENVYVEWGGEIRTSGYHPDQRPWTIFISRLGNTDPKQAVAHVSLSNQAIATSGDYMQSWTVDATTYFHIIHPRTLKPLISTETSIASTSVIAPSCLLADGLATAAMLFNSVEEAQKWTEILQAKMPELQFWIISRSISQEALDIPS